MKAISTTGFGEPSPHDTTNPTNKVTVGSFDSSSLPVTLNPQQAAQIANVTPRHIERLCSNGYLKAVRLGRAWRINTVSFLKLFGLED